MLRAPAPRGPAGAWRREGLRRRRDSAWAMDSSVRGPTCSLTAGPQRAHGRGGSRGSVEDRYRRRLGGARRHRNSRPDAAQAPSSGPRSERPPGPRDVHRALRARRGRCGLRRRMVGHEVACAGTLWRAPGELPRRRTSEAAGRAARGDARLLRPAAGSGVRRGARSPDRRAGSGGGRHLLQSLEGDAGQLTGRRRDDRLSVSRRGGRGHL